MYNLFVKQRWTGSYGMLDKSVLGIPVPHIRAHNLTLAPLLLLQLAPDGSLGREQTLCREASDTVQGSWTQGCLVPATAGMGRELVQARSIYILSPSLTLPFKWMDSLLVTEVYIQWVDFPLLIRRLMKNNEYFTSTKSHYLIICIRKDEIIQNVGPGTKQTS